jgi:hypothetical protein
MELFIAALAASLALNVWLVVRARRRPPRPQSVELQEFLADLTANKMGFVAVTRIDPESFLLRSPKR